MVLSINRHISAYFMKTQNFLIIISKVYSPLTTRNNFYKVLGQSHLNHMRCPSCSICFYAQTASNRQSPKISFNTLLKMRSLLSKFIAGTKYSSIFKCASLALFKHSIAFAISIATSFFSSKTALSAIGFS